MLENQRATMKCLWIIIIALISDTFSIQTHIQRPIRYIDQKTYPGRNFDIPTPVSSILDWEHGLREATVQALFREHIGDHNLRQQIYLAPLLGKQDKATPFGDVAILARGQLYANYASYIFVQDPYQNDCDDCDTIEVESIRTRCIKARCQIWHPRNSEQLIAIWSIKRIRHRAVKDGLDRMELEYTISPVGLRYPHQLYLTKDGAYNYGLPGHVFLLKKADLYPNLDNKQHFKEGAFIAQSPDGRKFLLHQFPGILTTESLGYPSIKDSLSTGTTTTTQYSEEDAKKLYQKLLEALNKKTSLEPNRFTPSSTRPATTLVQFPDGQVVPITEVKPPVTTKTTSTIRFPETPFSKHPIPTTTSSQAPFRPSSPLTTDSFVPTLPQFQPQTYETVGTTKKTTPHNFFTTAQQTAPYHPTQTTNAATRPFYTVDSIQRPQYPETTQSVGTTKSPVKTTFHFFAAEEGKEPTRTVSNKKPVLSSFHQQESTTENIWFESAAPTQPSKKPTSAINEPKEQNTQTTEYQDATRPPFSTISHHPITGTVSKVTRPVVETTYNSNTSPYHSTQTSSTIIHSNIFEPSVNSYQTTHKPSTGFTMPITVLDNTSPALDLKETFSPKEDDEQIFTAPHLTPSAINEPTFTPTNVKYTNTQLYSPTTELPKSDITTFHEIPANLETHEPTRDSTTFESILTNSTNQGTMETTLGVTTLMTKTTGMVYYTAEETQPSSPVPTVPTRYAGFDSSSSEITKPTAIPLKMSTPKRILTTISADGTVSVKTTPFNSQEELFGPTKSSTARYKTTKSLKASTTEPSDFLLDNTSLEVNGPLYKKPQKDYSEDEIFGPNRGSNTRTTKKPRIVKQHTKSDFEQELFDRNNRKSKHLRSRPTTEATPSKVIYSNLFEKIAVSTTTPVTTLSSIGVTSTAASELKLVSQPTQKTINISKRFKPTAKVDRSRKEETDKTIPVTSQSYLTSISYEVNRRRKPTKNNLAKSSPSNAKDIGDFAHRLVSQAKGVEYLDNVQTTTASTTTTNTSAKTTRKSKYTRRRTYVARSKKINRKSAAKNENHLAQAKK